MRQLSVSGLGRSVQIATPGAGRTGSVYSHLRRKILFLVLSGAATIILGLQNLTLWAGLGFSLVALTTVVNAVEPFFNWRSQWVLAEEAQHGFYRLQEDLEYLVATRRPEELKVDDLEEFYNKYKKTWNEFSKKWLVNRRRVAESGGNLSMNLARYLGYGTTGPPALPASPGSRRLQPPTFRHKIREQSRGAFPHARPTRAALPLLPGEAYEERTFCASPP
jgi:hypothetical protein